MLVRCTASDVATRFANKIVIFTTNIFKNHRIWITTSTQIRYQKQKHKKWHDTFQTIYTARALGQKMVKNRNCCAKIVLNDLVMVEYFVENQTKSIKTYRKFMMPYTSVNLYFCIWEVFWIFRVGMSDNVF